MHVNTIISASTIIAIATDCPTTGYQIVYVPGLLLTDTTGVLGVKQYNGSILYRICIAICN